MRPFVALCAALTLVACQSTQEDWPSLAYRPGEGRPMGCAGQNPAAAASPEAESATIAAAPPAAAPDSGALAKDARAICARLDILGPQWDGAASAATRAVEAAQGADAGSPLWGSAQIALSRMEAIGSDIAEQQRRADDLVQIITRAGLAEIQDERAQDVKYILDTAKRAREAAELHDALFERLQARLAPAT